MTTENDAFFVVQRGTGADDDHSFLATIVRRGSLAEVTVDMSAIERSAVNQFAAVCKVGEVLYLPTLIVFLTDWGLDGVVNVRSYVFGNEGVIVVGALALATLMNLPKKPSPVDLDASDILDD